MVLGLLALAALPVLLLVALMGLIADGIGSLFDRARRRREREQAAILQIRAREAEARYRLEQMSTAARQAILDAAKRDSTIR